MTSITKRWTAVRGPKGWLNFPPYFAYGVVPLALFMLLGSSPLLSLLAIVVLLLGVGLLWRPGEVPILLFFFAWQWLEASLALIRSTIWNEPLADMVPFPAQMETATMLTLIGLFLLAFGMRISAGAPSTALSEQFKQEMLSIKVERWALAYAISFVASLVILELAVNLPALAQPLLALANLRWAFFITFTYAVFARPRGFRVLWLAVFAFEFLFALGGFFSSFKFVFIFGFLGLLAAGARVKTKHAIPLALVAMLALSLGVVWSAIKADYRTFVNAGTNTQSVLVSRTEQLDRMLELTQNLSDDDISNAVVALTERISYVQYFGAVLNYVPEAREHTEGEILFNALTYPLMPRALFPSKDIIDESRHTNEFTNLGVAGFQQGTQISIGYIGDAYIDFGKVGMMGLLFALGMVFGRFYRTMVSGRRIWGILGGGVAAAVMVELATVGISMYKLAGGFIVSLLIILIANQTIVPFVRRWLGLTRARAVRFTKTLPRPRAAS